MITKAPPKHARNSSVCLGDEQRPACTHKKRENIKITRGQLQFTSWWPLCAKKSKRPRCLTCSVAGHSLCRGKEVFRADCSRFGSEVVSSGTWSQSDLLAKMNKTEMYMWHGSGEITPSSVMRHVPLNQNHRGAVPLKKNLKKKKTLGKQKRGNWLLRGCYIFARVSL